MYLTEVLTRSSSGAISHRCILLRESYREDGKVKNRTVANITHCSPEEIAAIRFALENKHDPSSLGSSRGFLPQDIVLKQGLSVGAVLVVYSLARELGVERALGKDREGKLALFQVIARAIDQGSRLSAVRFGQDSAICDILGLTEGFSEDALYTNLHWLTENQEEIQKRLFIERSKGKTPGLFLYDVTSSYLEGDRNEFGAYGYNRDRKGGKKQVVLGLLCHEDGDPVSVEVFHGNTGDPKTFGRQVQRVAKIYGCIDVTFVGDRGMIRQGQIEDLAAEHFHFITAITKPQIEGLLKSGLMQLDMFDDKICEVVDGGIRYVLRRNPQRAREIARNREEKQASIARMIEKIHGSVEDDLRLKVKKGLERVKAKIEKSMTGEWLTVAVEGQQLKLEKDAQALETALLANPKHAKRITRSAGTVAALIEKTNKALEESPLGRLTRGGKSVRERIERLKLHGWLKVAIEGRQLKLEGDAEALEEQARLDGCYALKTDLSTAAASKETVHDRYKDLTLVEQAFRTAKTVELEMRPWYVRTEESTRGHALVVMLAYKVVRRLQKAWSDIDRTVEEGLEVLKGLCSTEIWVKGTLAANQIPKPTDLTAELLKTAGVKFPKTIPALGAKVVSRHPLPERRSTRCN